MKTVGFPFKSFEHDFQFLLQYHFKVTLHSILLYWFGSRLSKQHKLAQRFSTKRKPVEKLVGVAELRVVFQRCSPRGRPWPRGHILNSLALDSKPQVLENCPLKFCWKTPETLRKICKDLFFWFP